ncbi:unnamed protein product [Arabidopsis lyrata]|nr:unnamed protein product [Arabidopsis lyrata]
MRKRGIGGDLRFLLESEESPTRMTFGRRSSVRPTSPPSPVVHGVFGSPKQRRWVAKSGRFSEIDPNSVVFPLSQGDKLGSGNNNCNKRMMNKDNEIAQKVNPVMNTKPATQAPIRRTASPSRAIKEQQEAVEGCKIGLSSVTELVEPQIVSMSRSLRKSRDFDFSPEALLSNNIDINNVNNIQNFHQKSVNVSALSSSMSKACSIVEAVADLNSTTNQHQRTEVSFTSAAAKKVDLMEPSFEKYVTVKRGAAIPEDSHDCIVADP